MTPPSDVERIRDEYRAKSIGPIGSAVVLGPDGPDLFLKVEWTEKMVLLGNYLRTGVVIDSTTQWGYLNTDPTFSLVCLVEWPGVGVDIVLFFPLPEWQAELEIIRDLGAITLIAEGWSTIEALEHGVAFEVMTDMLHEFL